VQLWGCQNILRKDRQKHSDISSEQIQTQSGVGFRDCRCKQSVSSEFKVCSMYCVVRSGMYLCQ
jgi:hypothetical protein